MARAVYPLGLAYLSTVLPEHEVKILDQNLYGEKAFTETETVLDEFCPDVVGISLRNVHIFSLKAKKHGTYHRHLAETVKVIKKSAAKAKIVIGGPGFSMFPEKIMEDESAIDFGVFLEGEESFPQLVNNIHSPEQVKGIFWRKNGTLVRNEGYSPLDFESLPQPRRDLLSPQQYSDLESIGIQTKRGCQLNCLYCSYPNISGRTLRLRSAKNVVDEIENLHTTYGVKKFTFADNVFNVPADHAKEICQEIIDRGLKVKWTAWFNERFLDENLLDLAVRAGCWAVEFSPDGYSNSSLKWLNKNIQTQHINRAFQLLKKYPDLKVAYNFMLGIPGQNIFNMARFLIFCLKLKISLGKQLRYININKAQVEPDTALEKIALQQGVITSDADLRQPTFYHVGLVGWLLNLRKFQMFRILIRAVAKIFRKKVVVEKTVQ